MEGGIASLLAAVGLVAAATITPGPNNAIVLHVAARAGFAAALPAIAGIVAGGLAMLLLVLAGGAAVFDAAPLLMPVVAAVGGAYLCWLGGGLVWRSFRRRDAAAPVLDVAAPPRALGLLAFQFVNPKSWVMVLTVVAAVQGGSAPAHAPWALVAVFVVVPTACLGLWCAFGVLLATRSRTPGGGRWLDRTMGLLLCASALLLVLGAVPMT